MIGIEVFYLHNFVGAKVNEIGEVLSKTNIQHKFGINPIFEKRIFIFVGFADKSVVVHL